jgi:hypothetical protein
VKRRDRKEEEEEFEPKSLILVANNVVYQVRIEVKKGLGVNYTCVLDVQFVLPLTLALKKL